LIEPDEEEIQALLERARRIAVVGLSADSLRPSHGVARYLQSAGYEILPVNPKYAGQEILGQPVVARVTDLDGPIDVVEIFRRPVDVPRPVDEAIAAGAGAVWMQLGIRNEEAGQKAADAGLFVVMDRCMSIEHRRLIRDR
jgi:predicted CoA-binding protein